MAGWVHRHAGINGIAMHYVEQGEGPLLILCHGFPHLWLSWHRQIGALADAGWRVVAPDMRGMGQTEAPADHRAYDVDHTVGDLTGLLDHLGEQQAVFAGLDFGLFAIYDLAARYPERVRAIIALQNPHFPDRADITPLAEAADWASRHFVHIHYFVPPGVADADLAAQPRDFLHRLFYALSGDYHYLDVWKHPPGVTYLDALPQAPPLPWSWLAEWEMEWFVSEYSRSGFTGGLNWYRAMDLRWHQRAPYRGARLTPPFYFIGSTNDVDLEAWHGDDPLGTIGDHHADVRRIEMIEGAGHMMQLERSDAVTRLMLDFLKEIA
ncbi:alpha/beta fold hydrolase [Sphingomonas jatrophae]|uniref:Pimeloyl-ACP methyl ester carboxylesterase n=1 Tax=Sphingomonas jatrophae TaxID=1166337 RepID=A0A1I6KHM2_9SPHN|nr:alpha/beta hydrolase [Sphingomonas jatrophae]SFR90735.1 Pimeloyl-ACP methyl ester carboxylesterase [Sphingomonas jatrophae]